MSIQMKVLSLWLLVLFFLASCAPDAPAAQVNPFDDFTADLEAAGAAVEVGSPLTESFFPVEGRLLTVNGASVSAWPFASQAAREAAQNTISADGLDIGSRTVDWVAPPHFFAGERLIVLYVGRDPAMIELLSGQLGEPINQAPGEVGPVDTALYTIAAQFFLAQELNIPMDVITFLAAAPAEWSDSCLGLGQANESCLQVIVPGYRVTLEAGGKTYTLRTDDGGNVVRIEP